MATVDYFERKLDDKRRLTIPRNFVIKFASGAVVTRGFGKYLHLYPKDVWDNFVEPRLAGDILDERIADLNVQFRTGKIEQSPTANRGGSPSSSICSTMQGLIATLLPSESEVLATDGSIQHNVPRTDVP